MFYSQFILAKKGPLGTIWIAAHLERKLRKNQVAETDIGVTVDSILFPEVPIALRLSGHLLLGVVRIYSRQVNYLFNDCSETLGKIKQAFHSAAVDLPPEATTAPFHTITLPETFDFDELELVPDSDSSFLHLNGNFVDQHVTTREQITLQDTVDHNPYLGSSQFGLDERFGDGGYISLGLDFDEELDKARSSSGASTSTALPKEETVHPSGNENILRPLLVEDAAAPSIGCENEATPMEIDDQCNPIKSGCLEVDRLQETATAVLSSPDTGNCPSTSVQANSMDTLIEHADPQAARKELDFAYSKHDTLGLQAYTPRALEACTPDLNQEYCPPDEPSTPALVDETSIPIHKDFTVENVGRLSPAFTGHPERIAVSETLPVSLPPHQVQNPWASSINEANRSSSTASFQGFNTHQAAPVDGINGAWSTQPVITESVAAVTPVLENVQVSLVKERAASVSTAENAGRFSPAFRGHSDRITASETLHGSSPHHIQNPWASSTSEPNRSPSSASFQGSTLHQASPVDESNGVRSTQSENAQICGVKENEAAVTSVTENAQVSSVKEKPAVVFTANNAGKFVPSFTGHVERMAVSETHPAYLPPHQVQNPWASSTNQASSSLSGAQSTQSESAHITAVKENAAAVISVMENAQLSSVKEKAAAVFTTENAGRFPPTFTGHSERIAASETLPGSLPAHQLQNPWDSSTNEANRSPTSASFQGFTLHQASSVPGIDRAWSSQSENAQVCAIKENAAAVTSVMANAQVCSVKENAQVSLVKEKEAAVFTAENAGRFSPAFTGHPERIAASDTVPGFLPAHQLQNPWASSTNEANRNPNSASLQGFALQQQAAPVEKSAAASTTFLSIPQQAVVQQSRTDLQHEVPKFPANASDSSLIAPGASNLQPNGTSLSFVNSQWGNTSNHVVSAPFHQEGLSVGPYTPQSLVGVRTEPSRFQPPSTLLSTASGGQASTASFSSPTSMNPSLFARTGSYLPMENVLSSRHVGHMDMDKNFAATVGDSVWQPAAQQCNSSAFAVNAPMMSPMGMEECETLRSAYNLQDRSANFSLLQQGMSHDRMPGLELDRNKFYSPNIEGTTKELLLPVSDKTSILRDETPFTSPRTYALSTPNLNSVPGDDDVLASILGRRAQTFKVISTPKVQKPPKATTASKRPKLPSRATPKRRKVELDTLAVLHGDVIRQQLASTEDIHRERRKAPCTRREVWGFLRECEGQENFDEPTLPELSSELLELYHDVLHGHESRPRPLSGASDTKKASLEAMKDDCSELDNAEDTDLLAHYVKRISMKDACPSQAVGTTEHYLPENTAKQVFASEDACLSQAMGNVLPENTAKQVFASEDACLSQAMGNAFPENTANQVFASEDACLSQAMGNVENDSLDNRLEQPKEDREEQVAAQQNLFGGMMGAGDSEQLRAEEPSQIDVGTEVLDGKEEQAFSFPEAQVEDTSNKDVIVGTEVLDEKEEQAFSFPEAQVEDTNNKDVIVTGTEEQGAKASELQRELETLLVSSISGGDLNKEVAEPGAAVIVQQDIVGVEEQNLPSVGLDKEAPHEGNIVSLSKDADLQDSCIPPGGKDAAEMSVFQVAGVDIKNTEEGEDKTTMSVVFEEETHQYSNDQEMAAAEHEGDADGFDEDDDVAYAEIDYSSDEQDASIKDDSGWSTRSRNVGKYLKTVFQEMESSSKRVDQKATLGLERLLVRRTRREAARMFFETLVLKTKDYIHVEQNVAYQDILLYPNSKLMKTEF